MPGVVRLGDVNSAGGAVIKNQVKNVFVNGKPICVVGDGVSPHPPCPKNHKHCKARTSQGSRSVTANGIPVVYKGNRDTCGHPRNTCSNNVFVGS
jgi:uncharacterized Zn-binding protein involved in type VI secretion